MEPGKLLRRSFKRPMELLRMLALLAGSVGLLRHDDHVKDDDLDNDDVDKKDAV